MVLDGRKQWVLSRDTLCASKGVEARNVALGFGIPKTLAPLSLVKTGQVFLDGLRGLMFHSKQYSNRGCYNFISFTPHRHDFMLRYVF